MDKRIEGALEKVLDPEMGLDIVTLGFIRGASVDEGSKRVRLIITLTSPLCPMRKIIVEQIKAELKAAGFRRVDVSLSFDPPWEPPAAVKAILGQ